MRAPRDERPGCTWVRTCALGLVALGLLAVGAGCGDDDTEGFRCERMAGYLEACGTECSAVPVSECRAAFDLLLAPDKNAFDACVVCLDEEADLGTCRDCVYEPTGESCRELLSDVYGLTCL